MYSLVAILLLIFAMPASATSIARPPFAETVAESSQIAIARSESLYGRKADGSLVSKGHFRTGPGSNDTLVSKMRIIRVIRGDQLSAGQVIDVDLWSMWHMKEDLNKQIKGEPVILMLKRSEGKLVPAFAPDPWVPVSMEKEVLKHMKALK